MDNLSIKAVSLEYFLEKASMYTGQASMYTGQIVSHATLAQRHKWWIIYCLCRMGVDVSAILPCTMVSAREAKSDGGVFALYKLGKEYEHLYKKIGPGVDLEILALAWIKGTTDPVLSGDLVSLKKGQEVTLGPESSHVIVKAPSSVSGWYLQSLDKVQDRYKSLSGTARYDRSALDCFLFSAVEDYISGKLIHCFQNADYLRLMSALDPHGVRPPTPSKQQMPLGDLTTSAIDSYIPLSCILSMGPYDVIIQGNQIDLFPYIEKSIDWPATEKWLQQNLLEPGSIVMGLYSKSSSLKAICEYLLEQGYDGLTVEPEQIIAAANSERLQEEYIEEHFTLFGQNITISNKEV